MVKSLILKEQAVLTEKQTLYALDQMAKLFPNAQTELIHHNAFELLIATLLSAQTTDVQVNKVTPALFAAYPTPKAMAKAEIVDLEAKIKTIGLYRTKAKNMQKTAQILVEKFDSKVPQTREELMLLPGVGRKTANVVLSVGFNVPALAVDTHVQRVSKRLAIVDESASVEEVERILQEKLPRERWSQAHHELIFFGRYFCTARKPKCTACPLLDMCQFGQQQV